METPELLWPCLPHLDYFFCNLREGQRLIRKPEAASIGAGIRNRGAGAVIVKLGEKGCWLESPARRGLIPTEPREACFEGHRASASIVSTLGAVTGWYRTL